MFHSIVVNKIFLELEESREGAGTQSIVSTRFI